MVGTIREGSQVDKADDKSRSGSSRIIIADDHPLFRHALSQMLEEGSADLDVVGEAVDGREAVELCRRLEPDLVLMDVYMPEMDGITATRAIKREFPRTIVLMLTAFEDPEYLWEALKAGAAGYILKHASREEVIGAIQGVLSGESPINRKLGTQLLLRLYNQVQEEADSAGSVPPTAGSLEEPPGRTLLGSLTLKELEILWLIAKGQTDQQIAEDLFISASTVKKHVQRIISKLEVSDRTQAAVVASGLLTDRGEG